MLKVMFTETELTETKVEIIKFINDRIVEMFENVFEGFFEEDYVNFFPGHYYRNNKEKCKDFVEDLKNTIESEVMYRELSPLELYVLYNVIDHYCLWNEEECGELLHFQIPDELKQRILSNEELLDEYEDSSGVTFLINELEDSNDYLNFCFRDLDFLDTEIRAITESYIMGYPILGYTKEMIDEYVDVMPEDVYQKYEKYNQKQENNSSKIEIETLVVQAVSSVLKRFSKRIVHHREKGEVELSADIDENLESMLMPYGIFTKREFNMGRAKKQLGETDLYLFCVKDTLVQDITIIENKNIENFKKQYLQLMGYLNPYFLFGITISINKNMPLFDAIAFIEKELKSIDGDFKITNIDSVDDYIVSEHIIPETKESMCTYHFILNLYDEERKTVAIETRE